MITSHIDVTRSLRRVALVALVLPALALALSGASASAALQPSAVQITAACAAGTNCTSFVISITNSNPKPINGLTIEVVGDRISTFALRGYATTICQKTATGNAYACLPFSLPPGATLTGSGQTGRSAVPGARFRVYTTTNGFATSLGQTVGLVSSSTSGASGPGALARNPVGGAGVLVGLGASVLVLAAAGFAALAYARRRRRPTECAAQQEALDGAEGALHYWHAAVAHLESVGADATNQSLNEFPVPVDHTRSSFASADLTGRQGTVNVNASDFDAMLAKAVAGRDAALRYRDQCQLDLINCMTAGGLTPRVIDPLVPVARPPTTEPDGASALRSGVD